MVHISIRMRIGGKNMATSYEVETRFYFNSEEEVFEKLPFLKEVFKRKVTWETKTLGLEVFKEGKLLRFSEVFEKGERRIYLGYKDRDQGRVCNIRSEVDEDITLGVHRSFVLESVHGESRAVDALNAMEIFEALGYKEFMTFEGKSLLGKYEKEDLAVKLMYCDTLKYPLLLEIEKTAASLEEAFEKEKELEAFVEEYNLKDRMLREEPPTLLYEGLFDSL